MEITYTLVGTTIAPIWLHRKAPWLAVGECCGSTV